MQTSAMIGAVIVAVVAVLFHGVNACTYIELPYGNGKAIFARSMELGGKYLQPEWEVKAVPRGFPYPYFPLYRLPHEDSGHVMPKQDLEKMLQSTNKVNLSVRDRVWRASNNGMNSSQDTTDDYEITVLDEFILNDNSDSKNTAGVPKTFNAKYGFVGNVLSANTTEIAIKDMFLDGMNEYGLMMSANTFITSQYARSKGAHDLNKTEVQFFALIPYILGQFKTVNETIRALDELVVSSNKFIPAAMGLHWSVADKMGDSIVIESINGKMIVHRNDVGVMTNDPPFDFHLYNLRQYSYIRPATPNSSPNIEDIDTEIGPVPKAISHGSNTMGIPGDSTPAGRFVKVFLYKQLATLNTRPKDYKQAVELATHIMNSVDIPRDVMAETSVLDMGDYTQWMILKDPFAGKYLYRTYDNMSWREIDFNALAAFFKGDKTSTTSKELHMFDDLPNSVNVTGKLLNDSNAGLAQHALLDMPAVYHLGVRYQDSQHMFTRQLVFEQWNRLQTLLDMCC